jgi:hypothetical protein
MQNDSKPIHANGGERIRSRKRFELIVIIVFISIIIGLCAVYMARSNKAPYFQFASLVEPQWGADLGYDGVSSIAFDSQNRPYMIHNARSEIIK